MTSSFLGRNVQTNRCRHNGIHFFHLPPIVVGVGKGRDMVSNIRCFGKHLLGCMAQYFESSAFFAVDFYVDGRFSGTTTFSVFTMLSVQNFCVHVMSVF